MPGPVQELEWFVGRTKESKQLGKLFNDSLENGARMVLISGETGTGKTALLEQLRGNVKVRGGYYLVCKSGRLGSPFPYHPLAELLRLLISELGQSQVKEALSAYSPWVLSELSLLVPKFAPIFSNANRGYTYPGQMPDKLFVENACAIIKTLLKKKPVVLVLEDIPYADPSSLEVLNYFLQQSEDVSLLICGTYDLDDIDLANVKFSPFRNFIRTWNQDNNLTKINLNSFDREESEQFIGSLLGNSIFPQELVETVYQKSEGNPLVIKHLIQKLIETGNLHQDAKGWVFTRPLEVALPQEIYEMFLIRLEGIKPNLRAVLSTAAVIGRKFHVQTLAQLLDIPLADLIPHLEEAIHLNLIEEHYDCVQTYYTFVSARLQEVLYENLSYQRKMLLHEQIGLLLEQTADCRTHPDEFAYHFQWGTDKVKAVKYAILAGQRALSILAFHSAWRYFNNAKDLFTLLNEESLANYRYSVLEGLAESANFLGYYHEARKYLGQLLGTGAPENNREFASVQCKLGDLSYRMGNFQETLEHYYLALQHSDNSRKAHVTNRIIQTYLEMGQFDEATNLAKLQMERLDKKRNKVYFVEFLAILTLLSIYTGDISEAVNYAPELQRFESNHTLALVWKELILGQLAMEFGQFASSKAKLTNALALAKKMQDPLIIGQIETYLARLLILEGKHTEALDLLFRVKSCSVYSHSFTLQANVSRQEMLAVVTGKVNHKEILEDFTELWQGRTSYAFAPLAASKQAEVYCLLVDDPKGSQELVAKAQTIFESYPTPRNKVLLLRAQAAYQFKHGTVREGNKFLKETLEHCSKHGLHCEALITCLTWPEQLAEDLQQFKSSMGLLHAVADKKAGEGTVGKMHNGPIPRDVGIVLEFIHQKYHCDLSIADLCKVASLSERQLRRLFTQYVGVSIKEYINNYRIETAKVMLQNPTLGISEIGQLVGIQDKAHFCKSFKANVGLTPSEYRKRQLESVRNRQQVSGK